MLALFSVAVRERALPLEEGWELRLFAPGSVDDFFRRHGLQHLLLWHREAAVSVFSPCLLWEGRWLALDATGEHRFEHLPPLRAWLAAQHRVAPPSLARLRALARWFAAPAPAPHPAPCAAP